MNVTIVSAFIQRTNNSENTDIKTLEMYINYGKNLLNINLPKIIFIEREIYNNYLKCYENEFTHFILFEKEELYLNHLKKEITNFNLITNTPTKDTLEYMMIMNNKTEWVKKAIEYDIFKTEQFIWIDFGIYHVVKNEEIFSRMVYNLKTTNFEKIRIASGWDRTIHLTNIEEYIYNNITWYFLGGCFGGNKDFLIKFADLVKEELLYTIEKYKTLPWEFNIWWLVYLKNIDLFDCYYADHDVTILNEYVSPSHHDKLIFLKNMY